MATRIQSLINPRAASLSACRTLAACLTLALTAPAFADNISDAQRMIKQGQLPQAMEKVDAYLSSNPKDAQGRFLKGIILAEMNKSAEAIAVFTKLTEDYPELPEPYNNLAVLYAQQKQYDKARIALETAIKTHPSYAIAQENLGDIYAKLASQAYDKALQIDNSNTGTQKKLSMIRDLISNGTGNRSSNSAQSVSNTLKPTPNAKAPTANVISTVQGAAANLSAAPSPGPAQANGGPSVAAPPVPPVAAPKPAATTQPPPVAAPQAATKAENPNIEISRAIKAWADAWSRKDMKAYFAAYAGNFDPPGDMSRKAWEKEREQRIGGKAGKISITVEPPQITINGDKATARFRQSYQATGISTSTTKTLVFVHTGKKWLIKEENAR